MRVKVLAKAIFEVVAFMDGDDCPAEKFLFEGEATTEASRTGLLEMLQYVAENGFQKVPSSWTHEANKKDGIYEFIKGSLRLFYFKGKEGQIAVCVSGAMKKGQKADKAAVKQAITVKAEYLKAVKNNTCEVIEDDTE